MDFTLLEHHGGFCNFFASCILYLDPSDVKACRLVSKLWNKTIMEEVWRSKPGREKLEARLVQRWMTIDPEVKQIGETRCEVKSLYANNKHVFCGQTDGVIAVFTLEGQWVRDLNHPGGNPDLWRIVGGKNILAAVAWGCPNVAVTVWSTSKEMEQLHSLNIVGRQPKVNCLDDKVAILVRKDGGLRSLVVSERGQEGTWEDKTLGSFSSGFFYHGEMAGEGNLIAVAWGRHCYRQAGVNSSPVVAFWEGDKKLPEVILTEDRGCGVAGIVLKESKLVLHLYSGEMRVYLVSLGSGSIRLDLIKKVASSRYLAIDSLFSNKIILACCDSSDGISLFEMKRLLSLSSRDTVSRKLRLPPVFPERVSLNQTQMVWAQSSLANASGPSSLYMRDFWMGKEEPGEADQE